MNKTDNLKIILLLVIICFLSSCSTIKERTYNLTTPLLEENSSITIVLIADLHSTIFGKDQSVLIEMIKNTNPDLIILAGDIIDEVTPVTGTRLLLSGITGIAPIYYVTGNHEYMTNNIQEVLRELISYGVIVLSDTYKIIEIKNNKIVIAGIEDPFKQIYETPEYNQLESMEKAFRELDDVSLYKILIAHRPELIEAYKNYSFDLILSGHSHGGQIRLPFGLYAPHQGLFPKYDGGLYIHGNLTHIISRGLAVNYLPRIFNPPELVIIEIFGGKGTRTPGI